MAKNDSKNDLKPDSNNAVQNEIKSGAKNKARAKAKSKSIFSKSNKNSMHFDFKTFIRFQNTIKLTIIISIILFVCIIQAIFYAYMNDGLQEIQNNVSAKIISSLRVFNDDIQNRNWDNLKNDLNNVLQGQTEIKDVIIIGKNRQETYSSVTGGQYDFINQENPASLKLFHANDYNVQDYSLVYIDTEYYYVYVLVPKNQSYNLEQFSKFSNTFFIVTILLGIIFSVLLGRSVSTPLSRMEATISKIAEGDLSGRLDYTYYYEINKLIQSYNAMADALQRLYSSLEAQVQDRTKELKSAYAELQNTQAMMLHSEKMKSLGELVAGIMHEINNPINFIYGNMVHLNNYSQDLMNIIDEYTKYDSSLKPEEKTDIDKLKQDLDYEFLKTDLPDLIKSCKEGADRAKNIIQDLKSFSRMEEVAITDVDLNHEIEMTLNILHNKLKNKAEIHKEFPDNLPKIEAFGGQLNQVFMNILDNAAGAIPDKGDIWIKINEDKTKEHITIIIEDNGCGMDKETARKIFNPFFTTKPVGKGTGLGLSITYKIIKNHQGDIKVESTPNVGTKFIITLPVKLNREIVANAANAGDNNG